MLFTPSLFPITVNRQQTLESATGGILANLLLEITSEQLSITATTKKGRFLQQYLPHLSGRHYGRQRPFSMV